MAPRSSRPALTPARLALVYAIVGALWIVLTDAAVGMVAVDPADVQRFQTLKGLAYIGGTAVLVYGLARYREAELTRAEGRLRRALQHNSILHRIFRHNLRNVVNVIGGNASLLETEVPESARTRLEAIRTQTTRLDEMIEKTRHLRVALERGVDPGISVDVVEAIRPLVVTFRDLYPAVEIDTDLPESAWASVASFEIIARELVENAVEHNPNPEPRVELSVSRTDDSVVLEVRDNGPGLPPLERDVLEQGIEQPLSHSEGVGLWVARTLVSESGGELTVAGDDGEGNVVRVVLPAAEPPD